MPATVRAMRFSSVLADLALWLWIRFLRKEAMSPVELWLVVPGGGTLFLIAQMSQNSMPQGTLS